MVFSDRMVPEVIQPFWAALQRGEFITDEQDLTAQRDGLARLGVEPERIYVDHGLTGTTRARPGLREALGRLPRRRHPRGDQTRRARPLPRRPRHRRRTNRPPGRAQPRRIRPRPDRPVGRLVFNVLAMVAEFGVSRHRCGQGESAIVLLSRTFVPGTGFASRARVDRAAEVDVLTRRSPSGTTFIASQRSWTGAVKDGPKGRAQRAAPRRP